MLYWCHPNHNMNFFLWTQSYRARSASQYKNRGPGLTSWNSINGSLETFPYLSNPFTTQPPPIFSQTRHGSPCWTPLLEHIWFVTNDDLQPWGMLFVWWGFAGVSGFLHIYATIAPHSGNREDVLLSLPRSEPSSIALLLCANIPLFPSHKFSCAKTFISSKRSYHQYFWQIVSEFRKTDFSDISISAALISSKSIFWSTFPCHLSVKHSYWLSNLSSIETSAQVSALLKKYLETLLQQGFRLTWVNQQLYYFIVISVFRVRFNFKNPMVFCIPSLSIFFSNNRLPRVPKERFYPYEASLISNMSFPAVQPREAVGYFLSSQAALAAHACVPLAVSWLKHRARFWRQPGWKTCMIHEAIRLWSVHACILPHRQHYSVVRVKALSLLFLNIYGLVASQHLVSASHHSFSWQSHKPGFWASS